jgi:hypothetical protein
MDGKCGSNCLCFKNLKYTTYNCGEKVEMNFVTNQKKYMYTDLQTQTTSSSLHNGVGNSNYNMMKMLGLGVSKDKIYNNINKSSSASV